MRAVVIATGSTSDLSGLNEARPPELIPFFDRPFIQHLVERLIANGISHFDFILHDRPELFESLLGTGERWGSCFTFHLTRDPERPYAALRRLHVAEDDGPLLLVHADTIPMYDLASRRPPASQRGPVVFSIPRTEPSTAGSRSEWTGCAWLPTATLAEFPVDNSRLEVDAWLQSAAVEYGELTRVQHVLSVSSAKAMLSSQRLVLERGFASTIFAGRTHAPGVRIGRNVHIHHTATITPPVYIGENSRIGQDSQIGPNAVVGPECILGQAVVVTDSSTLPGTFVGDGLDLRDVVADHNAMINARLGTGLHVPDDLLLSSVETSTWPNMLASTAERLVAAFFLLVGTPVLLATAVWLKIARPGPVLFRPDVIRVPAQAGSVTLRTFRLWSFCPRYGTAASATTATVGDLLMRVLPALANVARGDLSLVGLEPRPVEAVRALPDEWRAIYLAAEAGIITEARVNLGPSPSREELFAAEAFQAATGGWWRDLRRLGTYLRRALSPPHDHSTSHRSIAGLA